MYCLSHSRKEQTCPRYAHDALLESCAHCWLAYVGRTLSSWATATSRMHPQTPSYINSCSIAVTVYTTSPQSRDEINIYPVQNLSIEGKDQSVLTAFILGVRG